MSAAVLFAGAAALFSGSGFAADARATVHTVVIEGTRFNPEDLTVKRGDVVIWINKDPFPHTATASAGSFDSKNIAPGKSWKYRLRRAGVFPYTCMLHTTMKGTLHVK